MQEAHFAFDSSSVPWAARYVTQLGLVYDLHQNMDLHDYKLQPNSGKCSTSKVDYADALAACSMQTHVCCVQAGTIQRYAVTLQKLVLCKLQGCLLASLCFEGSAIVGSVAY